MRAAALLAVMLAASSARADRLAFDPKTVYKVPRGNAPGVGPTDAPVTIVAWSDYACGYCNRVQATLDQLQRLFPGQLRFVSRTLPLDDDNIVNMEAALAAAAQGRFKPMHDRLFALQGHADRAATELIARELGLDMLRFRADMDTHAYRPQLQADMDDAAQLRIEGTPAFFVNGRPVHGNQPLRVFVGVVEEELARAHGETGGYDALVAKGHAAADASPPDDGDQPILVPNRTYRVGLGLPGHQLGPDDALVTIIEWSDFQCPYCAKQAPILHHVREKYGDKVRVIYRHFALAGHRHAALAAEAAVAAAMQGKFWAFHDQVFDHFGELTRADLEKFAQAAGLDLPTFRAALDQRTYRDAVVAETAEAAALGVDGTPTTFINGAPVSGMRDQATFDKIIDLHLSRVTQAVAQGLPARDVYALVMSAAEGEERADPASVPDPSVVHVEPRAEDRGRSVAAACRRRDAAKAGALAAGLEGDARRRALLVCAGEGIDLPAHR